MKMLFVLTYYHPHWTGLTQYAKILAEGMVKDGQSVTVLTTQHQKNLRRTETINGVIVIRTPVIGKISRSTISVKLVGELVSEMEKTDRVVVFLPFGEVIWVAMLAKIMKKKIWFVYNGDLVLPKGYMNRGIEKVFDLTTKWAVKTANGVIVNTRDYALTSRVLAGMPNKWIEIVPPLTKLTCDKEASKKIDKLVGQRKMAVGFSGRWVEEKGFDVLLESMAEVTKNIPGVKFVFAGETNIAYEKQFEKNRS
jgi:glycosyltransferase involved in cell wall biosynthesis